MKCKVCGADNGCVHEVQEMMFGTGDRFNYFECGRCGCVQLITSVIDIGKYYPPGKYYSYSVEGSVDSRTAMRKWLGSLRNEAQLFNRKNFVSRLARRKPNIRVDRMRSYVFDSPVKSLRARVLDVGCGSGWILSELADLGFKHLMGIDPFLPAEKAKVLPNGVDLRQTGLAELKGEQFDVILMNHSLEHMSDQDEVFRHFLRVLSPGGFCRIEVPVADCEARVIYGPQWVEFDAPRHFFLHTRKSFAQLSARFGFEVYKSTPAGGPFEFWGSELYRRGLSLYDEEAGKTREPTEIFAPNEMARFEALAAEAATRNLSGREIFYIRRGAATR